MFDGLRSIYSWESIVMGLCLIVFAFVIFNSFYLWKKKIKQGIVFSIITILFSITLVIPLFVVDKTIFSKGINELYQFMLENQYGIEKFYRAVKHADFGMYDPGFITVSHNEHSPQKNLNVGIYGDVAWKWVDDPRLDAEYSADGRATARVMLKIVGYAGAARSYAIFKPGRKRYDLTKKMTTASLNKFRKFVKQRGRKNCKCWQACGIK